MANIKKIHHVAIVVPEIEEALEFWRDTLGLKVCKIEDVPSQKSEIACMMVGEVEVELVKPTSEDSGVYKFLKERGQGMHHICIEVDDIVEMLADLKSKNIRLINETPLELEGRKMAFVHPKSTGGVLLELYQLL
jgi:methylmalonyl-CoA/ethylmalonyl-CoA epimerase